MSAGSFQALIFRSNHRNETTTRQNRISYAWRLATRFTVADIIIVYPALATESGAKKCEVDDILGQAAKYFRVIHPTKMSFDNE